MRRRRAKRSRPSPPSPLLPPAPGLSFTQRLLFSGAAPDLVLQAKELGMLEKGEDLNAVADGKPLIQHWVSKSGPGRPGVDEAFMVDTRACLDWPVDDNPSAIVLAGGEQGTAQALWWEHAAIAWVRAGVDPSAPWDSKDYSNLIEWAHDNNRPWLLDACLKALPPEQRASEVARETVEVDYYSQEENRLTWLHQALANPSPLVAQVWLKHGADLHARDSYGQTPIFYAASLETLEWALKAGANPSDLNHAGELPMERWRQHVEGAKEWAAMQAMAGTNKEQTLDLIRSAVAKADVEIFKQAYELLQDTGGVFPGGATVLGYVARQALLGNENVVRSRRWRVEVCKMLRHVWIRTDTEAAQAHVETGLNDLQLAWVASMSMELSARAGARQVLAKTPFELPSASQILIWAHHAFDPGEENFRTKEHDRALSNLRDWVIEDLAGQVTKGKVGMDEVNEAISMLHDTHDSHSCSLNRGLYEANVWGPLAARVRDGLTQATPDQVDQAFTHVLMGACLAVEVYQYNDSSAPDLREYQEEVRRLTPTTRFDRNSLASLGIAALAWANLGGKPTAQAYPRIAEALERSGIQKHPNFEPLEPVWASVREQALEQRLPSSSASARRGPAVRL